MLNPRLQIFYEKVICEDFIMLYNLTNITLLPNFSQAILNSTSNSFASSQSAVLQSFCAWQLSTGQKSVTTRAHKSIAFFKIREETLLGLKVSIRKKALFTLLDKAIIFVLPVYLTNLNINDIKKKQNSRPLLKENVFYIENKSKAVQKLRITPFEKNNFRHILTLPSFLQSKQTFVFDKNQLPDAVVISLQNQQKDIFEKKKTSLPSAKPKRAKIAFLNKLSKNWEKQGNINFSIFFPDNLTLFQLYRLQIKQTKTPIVDNEPNKKRKYYFLLKKFRANDNCLPLIDDKKTKTFFTLSNNSALSFPEISTFSLFFDVLSGFSLTFFLKKSKLFSNYSVTRKDSIKNQLLSALGYPKI